MILRRLSCGLASAEIIFSFLGLGASLIPSVVDTDPFWGVSRMSIRNLSSNDASGVIVVQVDPRSPLESAGMQPHDRVIKFNGKPVEFRSFQELLGRIEPGEAITIDVKRDGKDVRLHYKGEARKLEGILFFDWQFIAAPAFLVLLQLLVATQPLMPAPLWRAIVVILVGLTIVTATIVIEATQWLPWTWVWKSQPIDYSPFRA